MTPVIALGVANPLELDWGSKLYKSPFANQASKDAVASEAIENYIASQISSGAIKNKTIMDRISDIFKKDTITGLDLRGRLRVRRNARGQAEEIVFVNPSNQRAETELSARATTILNQLGTRNYNLFVNSLPTLGE